MNWKVDILYLISHIPVLAYRIWHPFEDKHQYTNDEAAKSVDICDTATGKYNIMHYIGRVTEF